MSDWQTVGGGGSGGKKKKNKNQSQGIVLEKPTIGKQTMYDKAEAITKLKEERRNAQAQKDLEEQERQAEFNKAQHKKNVMNEVAKNVKAKKAPKQEKPKMTLEEAFKGFDAELLSTAIENAKNKFPAAPLEWLRGMADCVVVQLKEAPLVTHQDGFDAPYKFLTKNQKKPFNILLSEESVRPFLVDFFVTCVTQFVDCLTKNSPGLTGIQLLIQTMVEYQLNNKYNILEPALEKVVNLYKKNLVCDKPTDGVVFPLLWAFSITAHRDHRLYLSAFRRLMVPMLQRKISPRCLAFIGAGLHTILPTSEEDRKKLSQSGPMPIADTEFMGLTGIAFSKRYTFDNESLKTDLKKVWGLFVEWTLAVPNARVACFRRTMLLVNKVSEDAQLLEQMKFFLVLCIARDSICQQTLINICPKGKEEPEDCKERINSVNTCLVSVQQHWAQAYSPARIPKSLANLKRVLAKLIENANEFAKYNTKYNSQCREIVTNCEAIISGEQPASKDVSLWPLWAAFIISVLLFVVLSTHFVCRQHLKTFPVMEPVCNRLSQSGVLTGIDKFYLKLTPLQPYAETALATIEPYTQMAYEKGKDGFAYAQNAYSKVSPMVEPYVHKAGQIAGPLFRKMVDKGSSFVEYLSPYVQEILRVCVEAFTSTRLAVNDLIQKYLA